MKKCIFILYSISILISSCQKTKSKPPAPTADFSFTGGGCIVPCQVSFQNNSSNATTYSWDFGDGTNSTETNPVKTFTVSGTVTVTLTAKGDGGTASVSKQITQQAPKPIVAILPSVSSISLSPSVRDRIDETKVLNVTHPIYLPNNCSNTFAVCNVGPAESTLDYSISDLGGYFDFNNSTGSLKGGTGVAIIVTVKPSFILPPYGSSSLLIKTPEASNGANFSVQFDRVSIYENAKNLLGIWSGTWSGNSFGAANPAQPSPTSAVSGTWILDVQTVDPANSTASGTLTWNGTDAYWAYTFDAFGNITSATPRSFTPNPTVTFNSSNTFFTLPVPGSTCFQYRLGINTNLPGSSYGVYGPRFDISVNLLSNTVVNASGFVAWPYAPSNTGNLSSNQSNGSVSGKKN